MWIARTLAELRQRRGAIVGPVAFVPTMGALHEGHLRLIRSARGHAPAVIVSVFVNPTQFGPHEDFARYPRPIERDTALCQQAGALGLFNPGPEEMYPPGQTDCQVSVPRLARGLEADQRPGHFDGVCRVVAKLFSLVRPDFALFGMKDYQQLRVIEAMTHDLFMPVRIVACPTVREADGLAMSSRNAYLTADQRPRATALIRALRRASDRVLTGHVRDPAELENQMRRDIEADGLTVDYAAVRHPRTLSPVDRIDPAAEGGVVALVAARLGAVRLLDNLEIPASPA